MAVHPGVFGGARPVSGGSSPGFSPEGLVSGRGEGKQRWSKVAGAPLPVFVRAGIRAASRENRALGRAVQYPRAARADGNRGTGIPHLYGSAN